MYGAGEFGSVTVLSPDPESGFPIWETTLRLENRECNFMGVVEMDSDYYGFLIEHGVCSNDIWRVDHELDYDILYTDYPDFYDFLAKVGLGIWDESEASPAGRRQRERRKSWRIEKRACWGVCRSHRGSFSLVCNMIGHHYGVNVR